MVIYCLSSIDESAHICNSKLEKQKSCKERIEFIIPSDSLLILERNSFSIILEQIRKTVCDIFITNDKIQDLRKYNNWKRSMWNMMRIHVQFENSLMSPRVFVILSNKSKTTYGNLFNIVEEK